MNKNLIRKFATAALAAGLVVAPAVGLAPAAFADTDPTPAGDRLGVIHTDGEQDIVAITTEIDPGLINVGPDGVVGQVAHPCDEIDESVRVPIEGQPNLCYIDRSSLARVAPGDVSPATVPDLDPSLGIMPISAPINFANPAVDAARSGTAVSVALSALALGGTAWTLTRRNKARVEA